MTMRTTALQKSVRGTTWSNKVSVVTLFLRTGDRDR